MLRTIKYQSVKYVNNYSEIKLSNNLSYKNNLQLFFSGDVVISKPLNGPFLDEEMQSLIDGCDITCCNLEGPIFTEEACKISKKGPNIYQSPTIIGKLAKSGFNLVSLANNHIMDYGVEGLNATLKALKYNNIIGIGAGKDSTEIYHPYVYEKNGIRVGIISIAENGFGSSIQGLKSGYAWFGFEKFEIVRKKLIDDCNYVIVICHGGAENWDLPLPEYRALYQSWIDDGVCAVVAHHPHVPQGWETYKNGTIFYSLGNFAFDKGLGIQNPETISLKMDIRDDCINYTVIPTIFTKYGVRINKSSIFDIHIKQCVEMLFNDYNERINELCLNNYRNNYREYYRFVLNDYGGSLKGLIKSFLYRFILRERFSDIWLYHNLEIETHYWICRRALDLLVNGGYAKLE